MLRLALVGSGAAGLGVLEAVQRHGCSVDLFDWGQAPSDDLMPVGDPHSWARKDMAAIYRAVRDGGGSGVPLPKSHFGDVAPRLNADGKPRIWRSVHEGGLTNFWGGTLLPFRDADLHGWPFRSAALEPYYKHIARRVGVAGRDDGLSELFGVSYLTRPSLTVHPGIDRLSRTLHGRHLYGAQFYAGVNRTALDTRPESGSSCVGCGECMIGCFRGATFSTRALVQAHSVAGVVGQRIRSRVMRIDPDSGIVFTAASDVGPAEHGPYDLVFLAAGCLGSSEVVLRSTGARRRAPLRDSYSINVPIVALEAPPRWGQERYFGLANALVVATYGDDGRTLAQGQIYPTVAHFWRSVVPPMAWKAAGMASGPLKRRLYWMRMYLPDEFANRYDLGLDAAEELTLSSREAPAALAEARRIVKTMGRALAGSGFLVLDRFVMPGGSSSHYAAALSKGTGFGIDRNGRWGSKVMICDSSTWPEIPVQSPTFTIMANAMRVANEALG